MADPPPSGPDVSLTTRLARGGYQVVALLAMLAHLLIVGPLCLFTLVFAGPPGAEWIGYVLKATIAAVWFGFGYLGLKAWDQKSWWVVAVPAVAFCLVYVLIRIGSSLGWYLNIGY